MTLPKKKIEEDVRDTRKKEKKTTNKQIDNLYITHTVICTTYNKKGGLENKREKKNSTLQTI